MAIEIEIPEGFLLWDGGPPGDHEVIYRDGETAVLKGSRYGWQWSVSEGKDNPGDIIAYRPLKES